MFFDETVDDYKPSRMYGFVRARQLDGSFPGDRQTGVWPITSLRVHHGWGAPSEEFWPYDPSVWPPSEPAGSDAAAKSHRWGIYKRVRTVDECKRALVKVPSILASVDITDKWASPEKGRIPAPSASDIDFGTHAVTLDAYDDATGEFKFWNSWGERWGDRGYGYLSSAVLNAILWEAWISYPNLEIEPASSDSQPQPRAFMLREDDGSVLHCLELIDAHDERMAWAYALERQSAVELEELFVRPQFRKAGLGTRLIRTMHKYASGHNLPFRMWISYADTAPEKLAVIEKMVRPLGLDLVPAGVRWAPFVATGANLAERPLIEVVAPQPASVGPGLLRFISDTLVIAASSGTTTLVYQAIRSWIDARNGRRIRLRMGDLELETTQLSQEEFLKLLAIVREIHDLEEIRRKLLEAGVSTNIPDCRSERDNSS